MWAGLRDQCGLQGQNSRTLPLPQSLKGQNEESVELKDAGGKHQNRCPNFSPPARWAPASAAQWADPMVKETRLQGMEHGEGEMQIMSRMYVRDVQ